MKLPITQRTVHNDKLAREYFEKHGGASMYPRVSHQVSSVVVNPLALSKWGYNPTIARSGDKILMAYRWHEDNDYSTALAVAELDENLNVHTNNPLEIKTDGRCSSVEDPRFFQYKGELWMSYVESNWPDKNPKCVVKYGRLIGGPPWKLDDITRVEYGKNGWDGMEKNWVFFEVGGQLMRHCLSNPAHSC